MKFRAAIYSCLGVVIVSLLVWISTGAHWATRWTDQSTQCLVTTDCFDEGDEDAKKWECRAKDKGEKHCYDTEFEEFMSDESAPVRNRFVFGATPSKFVDGVIPIAGGFGGLAVLLLILGRRKQD